MESGGLQGKSETPISQSFCDYSPSTMFDTSKLFPLSTCIKNVFSRLFVSLHKSVNITKVYFWGMLEFRIHKMY